MEPTDEYFNARKEKARTIFSAQKTIRNPYFQSVMLYSKIRNGRQKTFTEGIEDE